MGEKDEKLTQESVITAKLIIEKLGSVGDITAKKMFGGHGLFYDGKMFCIVDSKGQGYLKVNDSNRTAFEEEGASKHSRMPYYSIPSVVFNNLDELVQWAKRSIDIALQSA